MAFTAQVTGAFTAVYIEHPLSTIALLDGDGFLTFSSQTFLGRDPNVGSLGAVNIEEGASDQAPTASITILPKGITVLPSYAGPLAQGAPVRIFFGEYNPATGLVVGTPMLKFIGRVDVPDIARGTANEGVTALTFNCISAWENLLVTNDGARLSDAFQKSVHPGDKGCEYMTAVLDKMPWGIDGVRPPIIFAGR
jgi:hypothetical protein